MQSPETPPTGSAATCNVAAALKARAAEQPELPALHYPVGLRRGVVRYRSLSYAELDARSDALARGLTAHGMGRGVRAALMVPPGPEFLALFFAMFKTGTVPVLIDPGIGLPALKTCLAEAAPEAFIGVSRAQAASVLLRWASTTLNQRVTAGPRLGWGGLSLDQVEAAGAGQAEPPLPVATRPEEVAAILFTSGSTGVPKGVVYRHRHFHSQVELLGRQFGITPGETDLATFPPFALFDPALGMTTVLPYMDPTRPAKANPEYLLQAIERFGVTNLFGSPALLRVLGRHAGPRDPRLASVRRVISAGAAVPLAVVRRMQEVLPPEALVHTPYGATECLPVASISSQELDADVAARSLNGAGICVGRPVAPNEICVIPVHDQAQPDLDVLQALPTGAIGEICVHGPTTTDSYWRRESATRLAKSKDARGRTWHRMGDAGYQDAEGRLWYCGRKSQRVRTANGDLYPDQQEARFNGLPGIARTALVGLGAPGQQEPVLCVELEQGMVGDRASARALRVKVRAAVLAAAAEAPELGALRRVLFHPGFPVDIRHNAKIGREKLALWAAQQADKGQDK